MTPRAPLLVAAAAAAAARPPWAAAAQCAAEATCRQCKAPCVILTRVATNDTAACCAACSAVAGCAWWNANHKKQQCNCYDREPAPSGGGCDSGPAVAQPATPAPPPAPRSPYVVDVAQKYGAVTFDTLLKANQEGIQALDEHDYVTVKIKEGQFVIDMTGDLFTVDNVKARGEFAVEGAGMDKTVLLFNQGMNNMIKGKGFQNVAWRGLTFSHTTGQTTEGKVVAVGNTTITLQVPQGFPTPADILQDRYPRLRASQGLYMMQYSTANPGSAIAPVKITDYPNEVNHTVHGSLPEYNPHLGYQCSTSDSPPHNGSSWVCDAVTDLGNGRWQFTPRASQWAPLRAFYEAAIGREDVVVGVKAKRGGQAYALSDGDGVTFERVSWKGHSRGIVKDTNNVLFNATDVSPMPPPAGGRGYTTASNGGGPQIHGAVDNVVVVGHTSQSSGDDSLAFFDVRSGSVTGCVINDGWGAGILVSNTSSAFRLYGNTVRRTPIYYPEDVGRA